MSRLKLEPRAAYTFMVPIAVRTTDLNYGGHLGNDRLLALLQEARVAFLGAHGWSELDCAGVGLIMADAEIVFRAEAFAGDVLRIEVAPFAASRAGFRLSYRATREADETLIALAESGLACFDYQARQVVSLPDRIREICQES
jgi:acyl-CoA thioester hydrolase